MKLSCQKPVKKALEYVKRYWLLPHVVFHARGDIRIVIVDGSDNSEQNFHVHCQTKLVFSCYTPERNKNNNNNTMYLKLLTNPIYSHNYFHIFTGQFRTENVVLLVHFRYILAFLPYSHLSSMSCSTMSILSVPFLPLPSTNSFSFSTTALIVISVSFAKIFGFSATATVPPPATT